LRCTPPKGCGATAENRGQTRVRPRFSKIPLSVLGLLQFISATIQFLLGVWLFHEAFTEVRLIGILLIWSALALYAAEGLWRNR
jgi:EamA domain-containing membrane protein RarD